jgi:hypothetical protein
MGDLKVATTVTQSGSLRCEGASCASQMDRVTKAGFREIITLQEIAIPRDQRH